MSPVVKILLGLGLAWLLFFATIRTLSWINRARRLKPQPATQDLPPDPPPPAVIGYLVNECRVDPDAAVATLVDLAARRRIELFQPGDDPQETIVRVLEPGPGPGDTAASDTAADDLTAYERRVLDRVRASADDRGAVPLAQLTHHYVADGERWAAEFGREVAEDAKERKLSGDDVKTSLVVGVVALLLSCATSMLLPLVALVPFYGETNTPGTGTSVAVVVVALLMAALIFAAVLVPIMAWFDGPRPTPAGRRLAEQFLGVGAWLRGHGSSFADLTPSSVMVWDRYLSFGAALGVTPVVSRTADLAFGTRSLLWSDYTGDWRQIQVTYPRRGRKAGYPPVTVIVNGILVLALIGAGVYLARDWDWTAPAGLAVTAALALLAARSLYRILRAVLDLSRPVTLTGRVLTRSRLPHLVGLERETFGNVPGAARLRAAVRHERLPFYVVVDDGRSPRAVVWAAFPATRGVQQCQPGDHVSLRGYRWCRYAKRLGGSAPAGASVDQVTERQSGA